MQMLDATVDGKRIRVKDCRGIASLRGLMFDSLTTYDGALITGGSVWMPFVPQPLDLIFLDESLRPLNVQRATPMTLHPRTWKLYACAGARYCLEVRTGIVRSGTSVAIQPVHPALRGEFASRIAARRHQGRRRSLAPVF